MATSRLSTRRVDWRVQVGTSNKAAQGLVIFEASVSYIPDPLAAGGPRTAIPEPVPAVLDAAGYACTPDPANPARAGERGVDLFTTDSLGEDGGHWTWTARPQLRSVNGIQMANAVPAFSFAVPTGTSSLDLATVQRVPASPGLGTEAAVALVVRAEKAVQDMKSVVIDTAAEAVGESLRDAGLVRKTDPGVPSVGDLDSSQAGSYEEVTIDRAGRMLNGIKSDGTNHLPLLQTERLSVGGAVLDASKPPSLDEVGFAGSGYQKVTIDPNGRIFEDALGEDGRVPDWILAAWKSRMGGAIDAGQAPMDVIVGAGQSNMGSTSDPIPSGVPAPWADPRIFVWTEEGGIVRFADAPNRRALSPRPILAFANEYARRLEPGRSILIVNTAMGGTGFSTTGIRPAPSGYTEGAGTWDRTLTADPANLYQRMVRWTQSALATAPSGSKVSAFLWSQGESDVDARSSGEYEQLLDDLIASYRSAIGAPQTPVVIGSMVPEWTDVSTNRRSLASVLEDTPRRVERSAYAWGPANLPDRDSAIHWSAQGQLARGGIFYSAFCRAEWNVDGTEPVPPQDVRARRNGPELVVHWEHPPCRFSAFGLQYRVDGGSWTDVPLSDPAGRSLALPLHVPSSSAVKVRMTTTNSIGTSAPTREVYA